MKCESCRKAITWELNVCELGKINGYMPEAHRKHDCNPYKNEMFQVHATSECSKDRARMVDLLNRAKCWIVGHWPEGVAQALASEIEDVLRSRP